MSSAGSITRSVTRGSVVAALQEAPRNRLVTWLPHRGRSSVGRALAWHARGRGFDPLRLHSMTLGGDDLVLCAGTLPRETPWIERLAAAASAGFTGLSVWARDYAAARRDGCSDADLRAQLADYGLAVAELDPAWWWTPGDVDVGSLVAIDDMEVFRFGEAEMFAIADALGARSI